MSKRPLHQSMPSHLQKPHHLMCEMYTCLAKCLLQCAGWLWSGFLHCCNHVLGGWGHNNSYRCVLVGLKPTQHCLQQAAASTLPASLWLSQHVMLACGSAGVLLLECCLHIAHIRTKQKDKIRSMLCLYKPQGHAVEGALTHLWLLLLSAGRCVCRLGCCDIGSPYCGEEHCGLCQQHLWHLQHCCTEPCGI